MGKNARKDKFFCGFIVIAPFDEAAFMGVFKSPIRIRHDNWDGTIFSTLSSISAQLSFYQIKRIW